MQTQSVIGDPDRSSGPARASIVVAAYNAETTLERALRSAMAQTVPVEILVVDDASVDRTADLAEELCAGVECARVLRQDRNAGPAAARNRAIDVATAEWITALDADDHMAPDRIERLILEATAADLDFIADDLYRVEEDAPNATDNRLWSVEDFGGFDLTLAEFVTANEHGARGRRGELGFVKPLIKRQFLQQHGLRYRSSLRLAEDYVLYAEALLAGARFRVVDPRGYFAVYRSGSLSGRHETRDLGEMVEVDRELLRHPSLRPEGRAALRRHCRAAHKEWAWRRLIDAVHARDLRSIATLGLEPPAVSASLAGKLVEQAWLRGRRRLGMGSAS